MGYQKNHPYNTMKNNIGVDEEQNILYHEYCRMLLIFI